jgi:glycosyltransferase involved in cell wall biosynthesis
MDIKFSIVIPAYNNAQALMLTLTSLELQTFPKDRYEVIVVDDGSEDGTAEAVKNYTPPYRLVYISNSVRKGRAHTRNKGARSAQGRYLVFLDADFLLVPDCLKILREYHHRYPKHVISGFPESLRAVYTQYYPEFSARRKKIIRKILQPHGLWNDKWTTKNRIVDILRPDDIRRNFAKVHSVIASAGPSKKYTQAIRSTAYAPWIMFITRCVSIKRKYFMEVGGFEERFTMYGVEDWELGYRLHKHGLPFKSVKRLIGFHQEHPSTYRKDDSQFDNLRTFYDIHGSMDPELSLICLCHPLQDPVLYKSLLGTISEWKSSSENKALGLLLEKALHQSAKMFITR